MRGSELEIYFQIGSRTRVTDRGKEIEVNNWEPLEKVGIAKFTVEFLNIGVRTTGYIKV